MSDHHKIEAPPANFPWRDYASIPRYQYLIELALPLPWLILSILLYSGQLWFLGPVASFFFFHCCLRLNHEAIHNNLGLRRDGIM